MATQQDKIQGSDLSKELIYAIEGQLEKFSEKHKEIDDRIIYSAILTSLQIIILKNMAMMTEESEQLLETMIKSAPKSLALIKQALKESDIKK